jgi:hypothetical protein
MNTPTEAQYQLAHEILQSSYQEKAAQLIADSEARAIATQLEVVVILTRRWLNVEKERDQLRAELAELHTSFAGNVHTRCNQLAAALAAEREKVRVLRAALENLCDEQNGAPLETRRDQWQLAMDEARLAIVATEGAK